MKNLNQTAYLIIALFLVCGFGYFQFSQNQKHKKQAERWERNFAEQGEKFQLLDMTLKEFKKHIDSKTDSILKIAKIKPKNVTQITNYNTYYTDTTISVIRPNFDVKTASYPFVDNTGCFEYVGNIIVDSLARPELNILERKFFSDFTDIEYIKKDTMHFLWLDWVKWWQKPEITYTIIDNCTGEKRVKKINIR